MSVATEITRLQQAKADLKTSIEAKGVTVPSNTLISGYSTLVDSIQTGGSGSSTDFKNYIKGAYTAITLPTGLTTIKNYAFYYGDFTGVTIPDTVTSIGNYAFYYCSGLTAITLPTGLTTLGNDAFYRCTRLTTVTIPNGVTTIGGSCFYTCTALETVTIGSGITSIGNGAFNGCTNLASVTIQATTPPTLANVNVFSGTANNLRIYVPSASVNAYRGATNWSEYASKIYAIPT